MDFRHYDLEQQLRDTSRCPADRYLLVAPTEAKPLLKNDEYLEALPQRLRPHYGWTLCRARFRFTRNPDIGQTILAVGVQGLIDMDRWSSTFERSDDPVLGVFYFVLDEKCRKAQFGPKGVVMVEGPLRGRGVGRYTLSQLVLWAKALGWGDVEVVKGELADVGNDVLDDNRERRNHFYEDGGFDVVYADPTQRRGGHFSAKAIDQLKTHWSNWAESETGRISELRPGDFAKDFLELFERAAPLARDLSAQRKSSKEWRDMYTNAVASWWKPMLIGIVLGAVAVSIARHWIAGSF